MRLAGFEGEVAVLMMYYLLAKREIPSVLRFTSYDLLHASTRQAWTCVLGWSIRPIRYNMTLETQDVTI